MKKVGSWDGMSRRAPEELWQYENRYDSDNQKIFDRDNDGNVDGCNKDGLKQRLLSTIVSNILGAYQYVVSSRNWYTSIPFSAIRKNQKVSPIVTCRNAFDDYKDCLLNEKIIFLGKETSKQQHQEKIYTFVSHNMKMYSVEQSKIALSWKDKSQCHTTSI